jgi:YD repeat-containing protein
MRQGQRWALLAAGAAVVAASAAMAAETIVYRYDARGRLVRVERSGTVNNNVATNYTFDKADNRTAKTTTGSPNPPPP